MGNKLVVFFFGNIIELENVQNYSGSIVGFLSFMFQLD